VRRVAGVGLVTMLAVFATALPLPWQAVGLVVALAAIGLGVRALRLVRAVGLSRALTSPLVISLAVNGLVLFSSASVIATWPIQLEFQECRRSALTFSARAACQARFEEAMQSQLAATPDGTPSGTAGAPDGTSP
jgi:hypothetical protein